MTQMIDMQVPRAWLEGISDEPLALQQIFRLGIHQYKLQRGLRLYRDGIGSLGYVAEQLGLAKRDLVRAARAQGIDPEFSPETVLEELA